MKKIIKTISPKSFSDYAKNNPTADWVRFRGVRKGKPYAELKAHVFTDQSKLCAYCEASLKNVTVNKLRLEHYHSKSDTSDPSKNWALTWNNIIGVCLGGSEQNQDDDALMCDNVYVTKENLSCDSHKAYLESTKKLSKDIEGFVLDPLDLCEQSLFKYEIQTGKLIPNEDADNFYTPKVNNFSTLKELIENTLVVFNLNCDRLTDRRKAIFISYSRLIKNAKKRGDTQIFKKMAENTFRNKWPSFFTTRRLIIGASAEKYLAENGYSG
ncbi:TPA: retron system putative HNH endonuclease [Aeromonas hydrophila]